MSHNDQLDLDLLKIFKNAEAFDKYYHLLDLDIVTSEVKVILKGYEEYYKTQENNIEYGKFVPWFFNNLHRNWSPDEIKYFKFIFKHVISLPNADLQPTLQGFKEKKLWEDLITSKNNDFDTVEMEESLKIYNSNQVKNINSIKYLTSEEALAEDSSQVTCNWRLPSITDAWGPIRPGQLYLVTATTHTGKSSFIISETASFLSSLTEKNMLYFNNERSEKAIFERFLCTLFNRTIDQVRINREKVLAYYKKKFPGEPLRIFSARNGTRSLKEIESACAVNNPGVVVIDQLDKLVSTGEAKTRRPYEMLYSWARNLAVRYNIPVIGVTQYGVKKDKYGDVVNNKMSQHGTFDSTVDKAANTDYLLGIQNIDGDETKKRIYLIRAKEGREGVSFICNFNRETGIYSEY